MENSDMRLLQIFLDFLFFFLLRFLLSILLFRHKRTMNMFLPLSQVSIFFIRYPDLEVDEHWAIQKVIYEHNDRLFNPNREFEIFLMNDDCSAEYQCWCRYNKNRSGQLLFTKYYYSRNKKQKCFKFYQLNYQSNVKVNHIYN